MTAPGASWSLTWWGHATTTVEIGGVRILTDPLLARRLGHLRRVLELPPAEEVLRADLVCISHLHSDHLHVPSLRRLGTGARLIAPYGAARVLAGARPHSRGLEEVGIGTTVDAGDLRIRAVPAAHDGRRHPLSRVRGPALGYLLDDGTTRIWFAGDTGLFDQMGEIAPVDLAIVPVGGWGPGLGPEHLDPTRAVEAVRRVRARSAVPMHYGTMWPAGMRQLHPSSFRRLVEQPGRRFRAEMQDALPDVSVHVLAVGETLRRGSR